MDLGARRWLVREAHKNAWRVPSYIDVDDLIQEGMLLYAKLKVRYPKAKKPAHMMRLFQISYTNYLHDLARRRSSEAAALLAEELRQTSAQQPESFGLLSSAPDYVRRFLDFMGGEDVRTPYRTNRYGKGRETTHRRYCRLLSLKVGDTPELPSAIALFLEQ